jgi:hypothetical protein
MSVAAPAATEIADRQANFMANSFSELIGADALLIPRGQ